MPVRALLIALVLGTAPSCIGASASISPPAAASPPPAATEIVERMLSAISRERLAFMRTYDIDGWSAYRDGSGVVQKFEERSRRTQLFEPPDKLDQTYVDQRGPAGASATRTVNVGPLVYTQLRTGWVCARTPGFAVTSSYLIFDPWVEQLRGSSTRVSGGVRCASGACYRLAVTFRDMGSVGPSLVDLDVLVDAFTYLPTGYAVERTYDDDGKRVRAVATFEYGLREEVSEPTPRCRTQARGAAPPVRSAHALSLAS